MSPLADVSVVALANSRLAPLVATDIDERPDEPGFLTDQAEGNGRWGSGGLQECLLHQVERVIDGWGKAPCQAV